MTRHRKVVVGTGLIALDVVYDDTAPDEPMLFAGGTCGNVMTILAYLGWSSFPVARLDNDYAGRYVRDDMKRWGVKLDHVGLLPFARTPVIIERLRTDADGHPYHTFSWNCSECGGRLPGYRAVHHKAVPDVVEAQKSAAVFFFDRVSRAALDLAEHYSEEGAIVFFEPSGVGDPALFREALVLAHVLKYSHDRRRSFDEFFDVHPKPLLEIETMGPGGMRYRSHLPRAVVPRWTTLPSYPATPLRDAVGSGDWFTAGLLTKIGGGGMDGLREATAACLEDALMFGQALAVWNCRFVGARGGMYSTTSTAALHAAAAIMQGRQEREKEVEASPDRRMDIVVGLCSVCRPVKNDGAREGLTPADRH